MKSLTVLIPIFNEEKNLPKLLKELSAISSAVISQIIFIDDGSSDSSYQIVEKTLVDFKSRATILRKSNGGKASAIKYGLPHITSSHVIILDSDLELATDDIIRFWEIVNHSEIDYVFGYRKFLSHSSFTWRYSRGNQFISNFYGVLFNEVVTDIMCGYKLLPVDFLRELPFKNRKFGIEVEVPMNMWKRRIRPYEIEVSYKARSRAEGKSITVFDAIYVLYSLIKFRLGNRRK